MLQVNTNLSDASFKKKKQKRRRRRRKSAMMTKLENYEIGTKKQTSNLLIILTSKAIVSHLSFYLTLACYLIISTSRAQNIITQNSHMSNAAPLYQQHNNILHFSVPEGLPNGTWVGNIRSSDGQIPYLVVPTSQTPEAERIAALNINLLNGEMTTNSVLDREHREQYHFIAIVKEPFAEIKCTVIVKDANDNAPMFLMAPNETNFVIEMPEGQKGLRKVLPLAFDLDTPQFGIKEFRIVSGNTPTGMFQLVEHEAPARSTLQNNLPSSDDPSSSILAGDNPHIMQQLAQQATVLIPSQPIMQSQGIVQASSSSSTSSQSSPLPSQNPSQTNSPLLAANSPQSSKFLIDLEVSRALDRENQSSYTLEVEAIDGGQPPLLGRLMVTVNVQDVNDNDPVFTHTLYECHFREDTSKGTTLLRVQAQDVDLDSNGQISYFIRSHSSSSQTNNLFNSNSSDKIESSAASRYNTNKRAQASIVTPKGTGGVGGVATATVTNKQLISSTNSQRQTQLQQPQGSNEIHDNSNYNFKAKPSSHNNNPQELLFEIDQFSGEIKLAHQLDYELDQWHNLTIEARDHGKPSRSSYAQVIVNVIDINDDPPLSSINRLPIDERSKLVSGNLQSEPSKPAELSQRPNEFFHISHNYFSDFNLVNWFVQINPTILFVIVLIALFMVAFSMCFMKIKSRQPEPDYNDDQAGLTLTSNNGQSKLSPNHSTSDEHSNSSNDNHHRHHDHTRHIKPLYNPFTIQSPESSNLYYNLYPHQMRHASNPHLQPSDSPSNHQVATNCGSAGGTLTSHNNLTILFPNTSQPLDRWFDLGVSSQLVYAQDWYGSYNWDYLSDWAPEYQTVMPLIQNFSKNPHVLK